jgi:flagellar hook-associated protein 2
MATSSISSLDVQSLVSQLMTLERQPIDKLNAKVTDYQSRISSFGTLKGLASSLQTSLQSLKDSLEGYGATPADPTILSAAASSTAAAGTYTINVTRLAQAQSLVAAGQASDAAAIASGSATVTLRIGGVDQTVAIASGASLQDIRTAINAADLGVTATIINDGSSTPYRLVLTANESGESKGVSNISVSGGGSALSTLLTFSSANPNPASPALSQSAAAQNASFTVNGIVITSASNTYTDAIQGVTLTLKSLTNTPTTLNVARDPAAVDTAAAKFVENYNALVSQLKSRSAYGTATSTAGALSGDGTVRHMLDQLRGIFMTPASGGTLNHLAEIGITTQAGGTLKLSSSKLSSALTSDFADVTNLFNGPTGFATRLMEWTTSVTQASGLIDQRTQSLKDSVESYNDQIGKLELRMTALKKQYTTTYTNLNMMLSMMNDTSNYLTSQFG